jgi:uncharacterized protein YqjF (DUF2071 family)
VILTRLTHHPFAVTAHFDRVVALSFAFPAELVRPIVPASLALDTFNDNAFVTVALVWTRALRPAALPAIFGREFFLAGYRVFTRLTEPSGRRLRGLYILRSETDKRSMVFAGNMMTRYNYRHVGVTVQERGDAVHVRTTRDGATQLDISLDLAHADAAPPTGSPFADWREARRFAGPMPFTFSPDGADRMVVIEGSRQHWEPRPVHVTSWRVAMFDDTPFRGIIPVLANAFLVDNVAYAWKRGRIVQRHTGQS